MGISSAISQCAAWVAASVVRKDQGIKQRFGPGDDQFGNRIGYLSLRYTLPPRRVEGGAPTFRVLQPFASGND
jgi:hypothetical protein